MKNWLKLQSVEPVSSSESVPMPVGDKVVVTVTRVNGKAGKVEDVASGTFDIAASKWSFTGKEDGTNTWLEDVFNNPPSEKGRRKYMRDEEAFLVYLMTSVMPRKGLSMDWKKGGK